MAPIIEVINLTKKYPLSKSYFDIFFHPFKRNYTTALQNINLQLKKSELFCLLGPNGAGKTTLIKILCSLILPTSGKVIVNGFDVVKQNHKVRENVGIVISEERSFYWRLTGRQNLKFFATLCQIPTMQIDERISELLELMDLKNDADRMVKDYSLGMKQKLAIARSLINDPQILFMDEPTRSIDPSTAKNLRSFIRNVIVKQQGKTVLLATHNLYEAEELSDQIAVIHKGEIQFVGKISAFRTKVESQLLYTVKLLEADQSILDKISNFVVITNIEHEIDSANNKVTKLTIQLQQMDIHITLNEIIKLEGKVLSCHPNIVSLEDIYTQFMKE